MTNVSKIEISKRAFSFSNSEKKVSSFSITFGRPIDVSILMQENSFKELFDIAVVNSSPVSQQRILQRKIRMEKRRRRNLRKFGALNHFKIHFDDRRLLQATDLLVSYRRAGSDSATLEVTFPVNTVSTRIRVSNTKTSLTYQGKEQPIANFAYEENIDFVKISIIFF